MPNSHRTIESHWRRESARVVAPLTVGWPSDQITQLRSWPPDARRPRGIIATFAEAANLVRCSMISRPSPVLPSAALAIVLFSLVTSTLSESAAAQCATQWLPGPGIAGTNNKVDAVTTWDPDGAGPMQPGESAAELFRGRRRGIAGLDPLHGEHLRQGDQHLRNR